MKLFFLSVFVVIAGCTGEGEFCDANGVNGVCTNIRRCPSTIEDLKNKIPRPAICGWDGFDVIVCCRMAQTATTTKAPALTTTRRFQQTTTTEYVPQKNDTIFINDKESISNGSCEPISPEKTSSRTGQKAWDKCIEYQEKYVRPCEKTVVLSSSPVYARVNHCHHVVDDRVVGGAAAAKSEFPHMVLLGFLNEQNTVDWDCGGTLISEKFVLTAGHCIVNRNRNDVSHALIGSHIRSEATDSMRYGIKKVYKHDGYKPPHKYNDIALLELDREVPLDHTTVPACLHTGTGEDDSRVFATGWGATVHNTISAADILRKVMLTKFTTAECSKMYEPNRHMLQGVDEKTQICYGDRTMSKDTCQGDSGGPLQVKSNKIICMYTIVGVTSFGQACGWIGVPGIYTRVSHYLPWIESIVWPN